jgi:hypothetical protein
MCATNREHIFYQDEMTLLLSTNASHSKATFSMTVQITRTNRPRVPLQPFNAILLFLNVTVLLVLAYYQQWKGISGFLTASFSSVVPQDSASSVAGTSFELAFRESLGFFTDITDDQWRLKKKITLEAAHHEKKEGFEQLGNKELARHWQQDNWNPDFFCPFARSVGGVGDGAKVICDPHRLPLDSCLIYSFGSNRQFQFEIGLNQQAPQCEIHIFDFTDYSRAMTRQRVNATYHAWGLKPSNTTKAFGRRTWVERFPQVFPEGNVFKTFQETVNELGHSGRRIDILKIDVEGGEVSLSRLTAHVDVEKFSHSLLSHSGVLTKIGASIQTLTFGKYPLKYTTFLSRGTNSFRTCMMKVMSFITRNLISNGAKAIVSSIAFSN